MVNQYGQEIFNVNSESGVAAALEAKRLADKYEKDFFSCEDLVKILSVGKNNVRELMSSDSFPTIEIGNRKVVSVISFTLWALQHDRRLIF